MILTDEQIVVVNSPCKLNICLACPGSGKTVVITERARRLANDGSKVLVVTFSNKAVNDIAKKIGTQSSIKVLTIHAYCFSIIKKYWATLGEIIGTEWPIEPTLATKEVELGLIESIFETIDSAKFYEKMEELRSFTLSAGSLLRLYKQGVYFCKVSERELENFAIYEKVRLSKGVLHFDDMISLAEVLIPLPEVSTQITKEYTHVLIDEAQDTSDGQWSVLRPLVLNSETTLLVGDVNQSLYSWRGADGTILQTLGFGSNAVLFKLSQSFRNSSKIADLANVIVRDKRSQIKTQRTEGALNCISYSSREEEVAEILKEVTPETAIISRTNYYLEPFERALIENNIDYTGTGFYRSHHIRSMWSLVRNFDGDICELITKAYIENNSYEKIEKEDFKLVSKLIKQHGVEYFNELMDKSLAMKPSGVTLTTAHAAKGLEWNKVCIVGAHEGQFPHRLSKNDDEERNIFYVAVTRSIDALQISYVGTPSKFLPEEILNGS